MPLYAYVVKSGREGCAQLGKSSDALITLPRAISIINSAAQQFRLLLTSYYHALSKRTYEGHGLLFHFLCHSMNLHARIGAYELL